MWWSIFSENIGLPPGSIPVANILIILTNRSFGLIEKSKYIAYVLMF
jgi:hypothetical protein